MTANATMMKRTFSAPIESVVPTTTDSTLHSPMKRQLQCADEPPVDSSGSGAEFVSRKRPIVRRDKRRAHLISQRASEQRQSEPAAERPDHYRAPKQ